jgi:ribosomal protein S18 acetylase RimI-like enzyme
MEIRLATKYDVSAVVSLVRRSWLTTWPPEQREGVAERFSRADPPRHYVESNWQKFVVAIDGEALVGMFHIERNCIIAIHVEPSRVRQGIGTRLMSEAERRIRTDYPEAILEVRARNIEAIEFYKRRGWAECRSYNGTEGGEPVDTIEMTKVFSSRRQHTEMNRDRFPDDK